MYVPLIVYNNIRNNNDNNNNTDIDLWEGDEEAGV